MDSHRDEQMTRDLFGGYSNNKASTVQLFEGHDYLDRKLLEIIKKYEALFADSAQDDYDLCRSLEEELMPLGFVFDYDAELRPYNLARYGDPLPDNPDEEKELTAIQKRANQRRKDRNIDEPLHSKASARRLWIKSGSNQE